MKTEIPFTEVVPGERFLSLHTKRGFRGIKIKKVTVADGQKLFEANAVLLSEYHSEELSPDAGTLISMETYELVQVDRPDKKD